MQEQYFQYSFHLTLPSESNSTVKKPEGFNNNNSINPEDQAFHNWYRFVLSYPPHLVRKYINDFELDKRSTVLDPFCGTGTTIVEAKSNQIKAIGLEANSFPHFASTVKTDWTIAPNELKSLPLVML